MFVYLLISPGHTTHGRSAQKTLSSWTVFPNLSSHRTAPHWHSGYVLHPDPTGNYTIVPGNILLLMMQHNQGRVEESLGWKVVHGIYPYSAQLPAEDVETANVPDGPDEQNNHPDNTPNTRVVVIAIGTVALVIATVVLLALILRLSRRMNDDIARNELSLENTSPRSRPSNLAIRYQELETVEWLAAKEELDTVHGCGEEVVIQYLCEVFVLTTEGQPSNQSVELTDKQQDPDLQRRVKDIIKERSDKCNIDDIIKRVEECMMTKERYRHHIPSGSGRRKRLETYISECCRLAWRMNVQTPAMAISIETDVPFDPALHERAYDCQSFGDAAEVIDYYVWPTLFDAENHFPVRKKGRVHTKRK
uniref:Mitochondria-eating protein n=1 Tax=Branchiostoma floridae TaxID=7739 RepID=C3XQX8_BRAFL|eukprot:XP_002613564.1 hypothetical protein BRAFLDRAFT_71796 [Branchiostoma floridae]